MKIRGKHRKLERGSIFLEMLVAGLLMSIGIMAMMNVWLFSYRVTQNTDDIAISYNLGRQSMEQAKMQGFYNLAEGNSTTYYNGTQVLVDSTSGDARFKLTRVVSSNPAWPNDASVRTITVTVALKSTPATPLYATSTFLVRAGI